MEAKTEVIKFQYPLSLVEAINIYLDYLSCYAAKKTIEYYWENLNRFNKFILESDLRLPFTENVKVCLDEVNKDVVIAYIKYLRSSGIKNVSVNTYVRAVRVFNHFLLENNYTDDDWFSNIKKLRNDPDPVVVLTETEYINIIRYISRRDYSTRNICVFRLFCDCGLRLNEVIKLNVEDIQPTYLIIKDSKYNKSRYVPLPAFLYKNIKLYIDGRSFGPVFLTRSGERITKSSITKLFKNIKTDLNLKHVHPHQLRHTFATSYVAGGGNLEMLRILLGHADLNITQNYLHLAQDVTIIGIDIHKLDNIFFRNYREK